MSQLHFSPRPNQADQIHWQPWSQASFSRAKAEGKPVLLAISAVWCHWCHVMDETSYSNQSIIEEINDRFIPIRVDNDQRPDINARYNMGGWPTTAFLTPDGEVLYGGTYIPPEALRQVLAQIEQFYNDPDSRLKVAQRVAEIKVARAARSRSPEGSDLDPSTAADVVADLSSAFDEHHAGFGDEQKFPHVPALEFLLDVCARGRDDHAQAMVERTLRAMAEGGMYDHVEGGFFRYSTTPDFSVPHFEKMLEDLGGLLLACARASALFDHSGLRSVAVDVKRYMDEHLWNERFGGYGGSQDADEAYYALDASGREGMRPPFVDPTIYTSWNAQAAIALLTAAPLVEQASSEVSAWRHRGVVVLETLWNRLLSDGLMCRYYDGSAHVRGLLTDQAWCVWAAFAAFSCTGDRAWLARGGDLLERCDALYDAASGVYVDRLLTEDDPGRLAERTVSLDDNALMARCLVAYAAFTGEQRFGRRAQTILRRYARDYRSYGLFAAGYASAVLDVLEPEVDIRVVGSIADP
ncbi:MAG TPA: DUF255 domain-containing protein, partial [Candidatus Acidoferrales bacterium]|nr:DUF255 domain-containing protein [Candidatus Acidoferrales bacterium]